MLTADQIELRNTKLGGSDAAVCAGLSPFMSARELYYVFRGEIDRPDIDPINAFIGHQLEPMIASWWLEETGQKIRAFHITKHHTKNDFAIAHPDRMVVGVREGLELKTAATTEGWGRDDDTSIPEHHFMQVSHYMEVFDYDAWNVAVFFLVSREFRRYRIERDKSFGRQLMEMEATFMRHVAKGTPPEWDYQHPTTLELLKVIYPGTNGKAMDLGTEAETWWDAREHALTQTRLFKVAGDAAKARILAIMGEHSLGYLPSGATLTQKRDPHSGAVRLSRRRHVQYQ